MFITAGLVGFVDYDLVNQFMHDLRRERFDMLILMHHFEERSHIGGLLLRTVNQGCMLRNGSFQLCLFFLISCGHHRKTLIGEPAKNIILIDPCKELVQFSDTLFNFLANCRTVFSSFDEGFHAVNISDAGSASKYLFAS